MKAKLFVMFIEAGEKSGEMEIDDFSNEQVLEILDINSRIKREAVFVLRFLNETGEVFHSEVLNLDPVELLSY